MNDINDLEAKWKTAQAAEKAAREQWQRAFAAWIEADDVAAEAWRAYWAAVSGGEP